MLTIQEIKKLIREPDLYDQEAEETRDACYELAAIIVAHLKSKSEMTENDSHYQWIA